MPTLYADLEHMFDSSGVFCAGGGDSTDAVTPDLEAGEFTAEMARAGRLDVLRAIATE